MCSRYVEAKCSVCCRSLDKVTSRIIVEICGHQKCRECFIREEEGCSICKTERNKPVSIDKNDDNDIVEDQSRNDVETPNGDKAIDAEACETFDEAPHIIAVKQNGILSSYKCTLCHKSFKSRNNRKYHLFCDKTRSKPFQCEECNKQFITLAHLKYHQSTHDVNKRFTCQHCNKIYSGEIALRKHLRKHQNDQKYECEQCNEKFIYKEQLNIHRNRHNNVYHECPECGKHFLIKSNFTKHIQSHSGLNRKTCSICKNTFSGSSALKTHMLTHSKQKSHQCNGCGKKFIDQRTLERHQKTHSDDISYECTLCPAKSNRKDNIRRHVRNLHSNSEKELESILSIIIENFSKKQNLRDKKTENVYSKGISDHSEVKRKSDETARAEASHIIPRAIVEIEAVEIPKNNTTSVIKFAGRTNHAQESSLNENNPNSVSSTIHETNRTNEVPSYVSKTERKEVAESENIVVAIDPITEMGPELPSLNYEPLNLEPFPEITPLPLLNTSTNLTVYRQLLSPYLRKPPTETNREVPSNAKQTTEPIPKPAIIIDRPPKKMIEKYEIYRN